MTVPGLTAHMGTTRMAVGYAGECIVALAFQENGYIVNTSHDTGDMFVIDEHGVMSFVEVKTARRDSEGKWHFTLYKKYHADHRYTDYVVLLCIMKSGFAIPFVIPTEHVRDQKTAKITSYPMTYKGRFAQFRQSLKKLRLT